MSRLVHCLRPSERRPRGGGLTSDCNRRRRAAESESHGKNVRAFAAEALFVRPHAHRRYNHSCAADSHGWPMVDLVCFVGVQDRCRARGRWPEVPTEEKARTVLARCDGTGFLFFRVHLFSVRYFERL